MESLHVLFQNVKKINIFTRLQKVLGIREETVLKQKVM